MNKEWRFWRWFLFGCLTAAFLTIVQAQAVDGMSGLLSVGEQSPLRELIETELGEVPLAQGRGHDGQVTYAIALDLAGSYVPDLLDHGGYRYRRILMPAASSLFGTLSGESLLLGMVITNILSLGLASGSLALILAIQERSPWAQLGLLANPGVWLSVRLLTVDLLAIALSLAGLVLILKRRPVGAVVMFCLAALTKDQYIIVAVGASLMAAARSRWKTAAVMSAGPAITLAAWSGYVATKMPSALSPRGNFTWPFVGIIEAARVWHTTPTSDIVLSVLTVCAVTLTAVRLLTVARNRQYLPFMGPWLIMAILASSWIWDFGNNAIRVFAPVIIWLAIDLAYGRQRSAVSE